MGSVVVKFKEKVFLPAPAPRAPHPPGCSEGKVFKLKYINNIPPRFPTRGAPEHFLLFFASLSPVYLSLPGRPFSHILIPIP